MVAQNCHPNTRTFSSLITACGRDGNIEEAERLFQVMKEFGVEPNVVTYNALIDMYGRGGECEMALQKFKELELAGLEPTEVTYSSLMSCLKAAEAYEEVRDANFREPTSLYLVDVRWRCVLVRVGRPKWGR